MPRITRTPAAQSWLIEAEAEYAADQAAWTRSEAEYAADLATDVNAKLAQLGITPVKPATVNTSGHLVPALLVPADPARRLYGVHATFDEENGGLELLVSHYDKNGGFWGLRASRNQLGSARDVVLARRDGPEPEPVKPPQPSADAKAIVQALGALENAVDNLAGAITRGLSRP